MNDSKVVDLFGPRKPKVPAVVPALDMKKLEEDAVTLIANTCIHQAIALFNVEDSAAFKALPRDIRHQKILHYAQELAEKKVASFLTQKIFDELGFMGNDPPLPPGPSSTYSA